VTAIGGELRAGQDKQAVTPSLAPEARIVGAAMVSEDDKIKAVSLSGLHYLLDTASSVRKTGVEMVNTYGFLATRRKVAVRIILGRGSGENDYA